MKLLRGRTLIVRYASRGFDRGLGQNVANNIHLRHRLVACLFITALRELPVIGR